MQQYAHQNVIQAALHEPLRQQGGRQNLPDGTHVVQVTKAEVYQSPSTFQKMLRLEYQVIDSSVQQAIGMTASHVMVWTKPFHLTALVDLMKLVFGLEAAAQWGDQRMQAGYQITPEDCANVIAGALSQNVYYMLIRAQQRPHKTDPSKVYTNCYIDYVSAYAFSVVDGQNLVKQLFAQQAPQQTPQAPQQAPQMPQQAPPQMPQQAPPQMPQQAPPQMPQQAPPQMPQQAPQMPPISWQTPQQAPQMPQQAPQMPQQAPQMPQQAPQMPQQAPQMPQQAPAFMPPIPGSPQQAPPF